MMEERFWFKDRQLYNDGGLIEGQELLSLAARINDRILHNDTYVMVLLIGGPMHGELLNVDPLEIAMRKLTFPRMTRIRYHPEDEPAAFALIEDDVYTEQFGITKSGLQMPVRIFCHSSLDKDNPERRRGQLEKQIAEEEHRLISKKKAIESSTRAASQYIEQEAEIHRNLERLRTERVQMMEKHGI